jgi:hypothetical protein
MPADKPTLAPLDKNTQTMSGLDAFCNFAERFGCILLFDVHWHHDWLEQLLLIHEDKLPLQCKATNEAWHYHLQCHIQEVTPQSLLDGEGGLNGKNKLI